MIKLIVSDIDGTIIKDYQGTVHPDLIKTINKLGAYQVHFVAASGRPYSNLKELFKDVTVPMSFISDNGGVYTFEGNTTVQKPHTKETVELLVQTVRDDQNCELLYSCAETLYLESSNKKFQELMQNAAGYKVELVDDLLTVKELPIKMAIVDERGIQHSAEKYKNLLSDKVNVITSASHWLDFMPYDVHKGSALSQIIKHLHIKPEECMAFGDQWNDVEMLSLVGTSYAMTNAAKGVADFATHTTDEVYPVLKTLLETYCKA